MTISLSSVLGCGQVTLRRDIIYSVWIVIISYMYVYCVLCPLLTAMMLTKSFSPSVSRMVLMVCLAIVSLIPFMLPLTSTTITTSLGEVAAWIYLK